MFNDNEQLEKIENRITQIEGALAADKIQWDSIDKRLQLVEAFLYDVHKECAELSAKITAVSTVSKPQARI